jgi:hypothetical protein
MAGGLGDGSHGLHARKSRAALDQARAGKAEAPRTRTDGEEHRHGRFALVDAGASRTDNRRKVPASALIVERSVPPHQVDEQPDGEHTPDHTEGHGNPTGHLCR